ncbi:calcineurin B-like protein 4 [Tanacetum coccineum]
MTAKDEEEQMAENEDKGFNATISAPHMHATCLQLLENNLQPGMHALDVGSVIFSADQLDKNRSLFWRCAVLIVLTLRILRIDGVQSSWRCEWGEPLSIMREVRLDEQLYTLLVGRWSYCENSAGIGMTIIVSFEVCCLYVTGGILDRQRCIKIEVAQSHTIHEKDDHLSTQEEERKSDVSSIKQVRLSSSLSIGKHFFFRDISLASMSGAGCTTALDVDVPVRINLIGRIVLRICAAQTRASFFYIAVDVVSVRASVYNENVDMIDDVLLVAMISEVNIERVDNGHEVFGWAMTAKCLDRDSTVELLERKFGVFVKVFGSDGKLCVICLKKKCIDSCESIGKKIKVVRSEKRRVELCMAVHSPELFVCRNMDFCYGCMSAHCSPPFHLQPILTVLPKGRRRQRDDNDLQDERQDQTDEEEVEPRRSKRARNEKSFGPDFVSFMVENEPTSYREAVTSSEGQQWREAIKSYKWIFKKKMKADGTVDKYKARLVIQGFRQREGLDYFDTYSPVTRITSIRMIIAIAACQSTLRGTKFINTHNAGDSGLARTPIDTSTRPDLAYAVSRLSRTSAVIEGYSDGKLDI